MTLATGADSISDFNTPPTLSEIADALDDVSVSAGVVTVVSSPQPEISAVAGVVSEVAAAGAFLAEPTKERAGDLMFGGVVKGAKAVLKGAGGTTEALGDTIDNGNKLREAAQEIKNDAIEDARERR